LRDIDQLMLLQRVRQAPVEASANGALVFTELRDDGLLAFLHDKESCTQPDQHSHACNQEYAFSGIEGFCRLASTTARRRTSAIARASAKQARELAVEISPNLFQIRWLTLLRGRRRTRTLLRSRRRHRALS